jgi:hypothetical protein
MLEYPNWHHAASPAGVLLAQAGQPSCFFQYQVSNPNWYRLYDSYEIVKIQLPFGSFCLKLHQNIILIS